MKFILITILFISTEAFAIEKTICGKIDNRSPSNDTRIGRASKRINLVGCTVTLINENCAISAGHCSRSLEKVSFNVPVSRNSTPQASKPSDTYYLDKSYLHFMDNGPGADWAVLKLKKNHVTDKFPGEVQGFYEVELSSHTRVGKKVRITGFGKDVNDPYKSFAQQSSVGKVIFAASRLGSSKIGHSVDTMGGNSGSTIISEESNKVVGVHSHGGCRSFGGVNFGTLISANVKFKEAILNCTR